jgi:RimJ/RimL family protein N-acetyltransferase
MTSPHPTLRAWREDDFPAFVLLHSDPHVVEWLGGVQMNTEQMRAGFERTRAFLDENGWGMWAIIDEQGLIVGAAGLQRVRKGMPSFPGIEAAWRLAFAAQGKGRVTTAMKAMLPWAFANIAELSEIQTFTARSNLKSQNVMKRLGFAADPSRDFDHPSLPEGHPLRAHVFYAMKRPVSG